MNRLIFILLGFSMIFAASTQASEIIFFDYAASPVSASASAVEGGGIALDSLFFSMTGASTAAGDLEISLSALADKSGKVQSATVELGNGFALAAENDTIDLNTDFSTQPEELISVTSRNQSDIYSDYLALRFTNGSGEFFYGWAEVLAEVDIAPNGKTATAAFSVSRFAFNNTAGESILAGQIPEPAAATLVIGAGISLLAGRRLFMK